MDGKVAMPHSEARRGSDTRRDYIYTGVKDLPFQHGHIGHIKCINLPVSTPVSSQVEDDKMTVVKQQKTLFGTECLPSKCCVELSCALDLTKARSASNNTLLVTNGWDLNI